MKYYKNFDFKQAKRLILLALKEDIGKGDLTSDLLIPNNSRSRAEIKVKEDGILAGIELFRLVFRIIDKGVSVKFIKRDGDFVRAGEVAGYVSGKTKSLLKGERVALNILQRISGIATKTNKLRLMLNSNSTKIIDTRKTTPNFRLFEKLGVLIGGGENHRFGLYDMVLIKDNHIEANKGIGNTLIALKNRKRIKQKVEIEVKNLSELEIVIKEGKEIIDRVLLDNFAIKDTRTAIKMIRNHFEVEVSGGVNEKNISLYRNLKGIDFISIGSLTHSVNSLDISFDFIT